MDLPAKLSANYSWKQDKMGEGLLRIHLWCPEKLPRLWDRIEIELRVNTKGTKFIFLRFIEV